MLYQESDYLRVKQSRQQICYQELTEAFERLGYDFNSAKRSILMCSKTLSSKGTQSDESSDDLSEHACSSIQKCTF